GTRETEGRCPAPEEGMARIFRQRGDVAGDLGLDHGAHDLDLRDLAIEQVADRLGAAAQRLLERMTRKLVKLREPMPQTGVETGDVTLPGRRSQDRGGHESIIVVEAFSTRIALEAPAEPAIGEGLLVVPIALAEHVQGLGIALEEDEGAGIFPLQRHVRRILAKT